MHCMMVGQWSHALASQVEHDVIDPTCPLLAFQLVEFIFAEY
jgi:hypothetical protein